MLFLLAHTFHNFLEHVMDCRARVSPGESEPSLANKKSLDIEASTASAAPLLERQNLRDASPSISTTASLDVEAQALEGQSKEIVEGSR